MQYRIHENYSIFKGFLLSKLTATSLVLLAPEPGIGVGDLDGELSCPLHNHLPVFGGDVVGDLSTVGPTGRKGGRWVNDRAFYFEIPQ